MPNQNRSRRGNQIIGRAVVAMESFERRMLLSGGPEPVTLLDELVLPGDLQIGAAPFAQNDPYIAPGPDGTSLAVWTDLRTGGHPNLLFGVSNGTMADIWAARIAADGTLIDQVPLSINNDQWHQTAPKAAWNGSSWLISWTSMVDASYTQIHATRLSPGGQVLDPTPIVIMDNRYLDQYGNPTSPEGPLDVQPAGGDRFVVTWSRQEPPAGGSLQVAHFGTIVEADGTLPEPDGRLLRRGGSQNLIWGGLVYSPSNGGQFLQVFGIDGYDASWGNADTLYVARRNLDLTPIDTAYTVMNVGDFSGFQRKIVGSPHGWLVAYRNVYGQTNPWISALRIGANGSFADDAPMTISPAGGDPKVAAAFDGDGYVVTYTQGLSGNQLWHRRIPPTGAMGSPVLLQTLGNPIYSLQSEGMNAGQYQILLADSTGGTTDIALVRVAADDTTSAVQDVSNAARSHTAPQIASDGTNSLLTFRSFNADEAAIKGMRLTPTGQPIEDEPFTIVPQSFDPGAPNVVFLEGRYVVIFRGTGSAGTILYGQQVSPDGQLIGTPVALTGGMGNGEASVLGNRLLISGLSNEGSLERSYRFARIFDENLNPLTDRINLSHGFTGGGDVTTVGGRWLLAYTWKSSHNAPRRGVAYAFVSPDGTFTPPQSLVSTYPDNGGVTVVSAGPDAPEAMIIWQRWDLPPDLGGPFWFPNSNEGLIGQRMAADGTRIGELLTIVDEPGNSVAPRAIFDGSNYVVTWVDTRNGVYPRQEVPDVFAARVAIDGTVLDPGGFDVASRHAPEDSVVAVSGAGRTYFAYRSFRYEAPYASYRITTRLLDDVHAPQSSGAPIFDPNAAHPAQPGPNMGTAFSERLYGATGGDLVLTNISTGQTINAGSLAIVERVGAAGTWEYDWIHTGGALPDGSYTATLPAGSVVDKAGNPLATDVTFTFAFLNGDANRDGRVNLEDFNILAANFGQSGRTFSQGDFNYDGVVNLEDFNILASRFGVALAPGAGAGFAAVPGGSDPIAPDEELVEPLRELA